MVDSTPRIPGVVAAVLRRFSKNRADLANRVLHDLTAKFVGQQTAAAVAPIAKQVETPATPLVLIQLLAVRQVRDLPERDVVRLLSADVGELHDYLPPRSGEYLKARQPAALPDAQPDSRSTPSVPDALRRLSSTLPELLVAAEAIVDLWPAIRLEERLPSDAVVDRENRDDLVLELDMWLANRLVELLARQTCYPIICEELDRGASMADLRARVAHSERSWVVDPLDGSSAFLHRAGAGYPSVMIAVLRSSPMEIEILGSIVFFPLSNEWYYAVKGCGAYAGDRQLLPANATPRLEDVWISMNHYTVLESETDFMKEAKTALRGERGVQMLSIEPPHSGIAMRVVDPRYGLAAVIHDNRTGLPGTQPKQMVWDVCAPKLIVEEARGIFWNTAGEPYDPFGEPRPIIVASHRTLGREILDAVRGQGRRTSA